MTEPDITVNGVVLSPAQAMTLRVALEVFANDLCEDAKTAEYNQWKTMIRDYQDRIQEIRALMLRKEQS